MKKNTLMLAMMLVMAAMASTAYAGDYIVVRTVYVTGTATNVTIGGQLYYAGAANVTINVTSDVNDTVRVRYANGSNVTLANRTAAGANTTWEGTLILPSTTQYTNFTAFGNRTDGATSGTYNATLEAGVDAVAPTVTDMRPNVLARGRPGDVVNFSVRVSDDIANNDTLTLDFTSIPGGSSVVDTTVTCSGGTNCTANVTVTLDVTGDYVYRWTGVDNVSNAVTGTSVTYSHLRNAELPPDVVRQQQEVNRQMQITGDSQVRQSDIISDFFGGILDFLFGWL